jgi:hypothetical protein
MTVRARSSLQLDQLINPIILQGRHEISRPLKGTYEHHLAAMFGASLASALAGSRDQLNHNPKGGAALRSTKSMAGGRRGRPLIQIRCLAQSGGSCNRCSLPSD